MSNGSDKAYQVTFAPEANQELSALAHQLHITKEEALRQALLLFKYAVEAEGVELTSKEGRRQKVRLGR